MIPDLNNIYENVNLSEKTKSQYIKLLNLWKTNLGKSLENIIKTPSKSSQVIYSKYPELQTRKAYISAIISLFNAIPELKVQYEVSHKKWIKMAVQINQDVKNRYSEGFATARQTSTYIPWTNVVEKYKELAKLEYGSKKHLLLAMYVLEAPKRQDYGNVQFIMSGKPVIDGQNYIVISKDGSGKLILSKYKTEKHYGTLEFELSNELMHVILTSIKDMPRKYLFETRQGTPYSDDAYIKFTSRVFEDILGKGVTVTTLRHSKIKYEYENGMTHKQREDLSKRMCHSIGMQSSYSFEIGDKSCKVICKS
jgi:hypothetical protein